MELLWDPILANAILCFHEEIWLMNVLMNSNLYTTKGMSMKYLFYFVYLIILRNSKII